MIVRISGEGQYELADDDKDRLNALENAVVSVVESGEESGFEDAFAALLDFVRDAGALVGRRRARGLRCDPAACGHHLRRGRRGLHRRGPDTRLMRDP